VIEVVGSKVHRQWLGAGIRGRNGELSRSPGGRDNCAVVAELIATDPVPGGKDFSDQASFAKFNEAGITHCTQHLGEGVRLQARSNRLH